MGTGFVQMRWLKVINLNLEGEVFLEQLAVLGLHLHNEVGESRDHLLIDIDDLRKEIAIG